MPNTNTSVTWLPGKPSLHFTSSYNSFKYFIPFISFDLLYLQLLEAAQSLSLSLTKADANEKGKKDVTDDADKLVKTGEGPVVTPEMGPDEV
jgi:hypothetical protein